jgi:acyl-coenzyme A thioesterase PaaI-like protein
MSLVHHELCFGCGTTNLFGLLLEAERQPDGSAAGRCFIKQDHQGGVRGFAHDGIVAAALEEVMALTCGPNQRAHAVTVGFLGGVPVGEFLHVQASIEARTDGELTVTASASAEGQVVAKARGTYSESRA